MQQSNGPGSEPPDDLAAESGDPASGDCADARDTALEMQCASQQEDGDDGDPGDIEACEPPPPTGTSRRRPHPQRALAPVSPPEGLDADDTDRGIEDGWPLSDRNRLQDQSREVTARWRAKERVEEVVTGDEL